MSIEKLDTWAPSGTKTAPSAGLRSSGFVSGTQASAQNFNFLLDEQINKTNEVIDAMPLGFPVAAGVDPIIEKYVPTGSAAIWNGRPGGYTVNSGNADIVSICVWFNSSGAKRILVLDADTGGDSRVYLFDQADMSLVSDSGDITTGNLPGGQGTHYAVAMCVDANYAYVMFQSSSGYHNIQCYNISESSWTVRTGWGATGTALPTPNDAVTDKWRRGQVIIADATYIATVNSWVRCTASSSNGISIIQRSNGTLVDSGAGDIGDQSGEYFYPFRAGSDGTNLYVAFTEHSGTSAPNGTRIYSDLIATATIADPDTGIGSPYPFEPGADNWVEGICVFGGYAYSTWGATGTDTRKLLRVHTSTVSDIGWLYASATGNGTYLGTIVTDGMAMWARGVRLVESGVSADEMYRINHMALPVNGPTSCRLEYLENTSRHYVATPFTSSTGESELVQCAPVCYDGEAIYYAGSIEATDSYGSIIYKIPHAILR